MSTQSKVLVIAEHDHATLKKATLSTIACALGLGEVHVLVAGSDCTGAAEAAAQVDGVARVLCCDDARYTHALAVALAPLVVGTAGAYSHLLAPASTFGKDLMPRIAALLDVAQISDVIAVLAPDTFRRPIYAGKGIATVKSLDAVKVLTVRPTAFDPQKVDGGGTGVIQTLAPVELPSHTRFVGETLAQSGRPELSAARVIVSGGRGMGSAGNFRLLEKLADRLGAGIGATRSAVDAGFAPNDWQVGQTGKIVAPDLYIAVGISGAIQHLAGMKDSKVIVAINKDPEAPIHQCADYALVADLFQAVPELTAALG